MLILKLRKNPLTSLKIFVKKVQKLCSLHSPTALMVPRHLSLPWVSCRFKQPDQKKTLSLSSSLWNRLPLSTNKFLRLKLLKWSLCTHSFFKKCVKLWIRELIPGSISRLWNKYRFSFCTYKTTILLMPQKHYKTRTYLIHWYKTFFNWTCKSSMSPITKNIWIVERAAT